MVASARSHPPLPPRVFYLWRWQLFLLKKWGRAVGTKITHSLATATTKCLKKLAAFSLHSKEWSAAKKQLSHHQLLFCCVRFPECSKNAAESAATYLEVIGGGIMMSSHHHQLFLHLHTQGSDTRNHHRRSWTSLSTTS